MSGIESLVLVFKRHYLTAVAAVAATFGAAYIYLHRATPLYETTARLMIDEPQVSVSEFGQALAEIQESRGSDPFATQAELIKSQRVLQRALSKLAKQTPQPLPTPKEASANLRVTIVPATNILELSYRDPDSEQAVMILNAIVEAMVAENTESISRKASSVRQFLETKVPQQLARLEAAEVAESRYRQSTGLIAAETQIDSLVQGLAALDQESQDLAAQVQEVMTRNNLLQQITGTDALQQAYLVMRLGQDEELAQMRQKLLDLEAQVIENRSRLGDQHPDLLALIQQRDEMRTLYSQQVTRISSTVDPNTAAVDAASQKLLSDYIAGEVQQIALTDRLQVVTAQRANLQTRLTDLPTKQLQLATLARQREEVAATLKFLQNKLEEARLAEAQLISNIRVVALAEIPLEPIVPQPKAVLVIAGMAGIALAGSLMVLLENLDNTLRTPAEAEVNLKLPVLGILPKLPAGLQGGALEIFLQHSTATASYHRLLKTLDLQSKNQSKVILISSTLAGEGKANVAIRLAAIAALLGRRTLLIDANSHSFTAYSKTEHEQEFWVKGGDEINGAVPPLLSIASLVELVDASALPLEQFFTHPSQMLEATVIQPIMMHATEHYDLVIVDAPPLSQSADAMTLSQYVDTFVLVVRPEFAPKAVIQQSISELQKNGVSILGIVLNDNPDIPTQFPQNSLGQSFHYSQFNDTVEQKLSSDGWQPHLKIRS
jgi:polysaccharide biosynthesis transport protein